METLIQGCGFCGAVKFVTGSDFSGTESFELYNTIVQSFLNFIWWKSYKEHICVLIWTLLTTRSTEKKEIIEWVIENLSGNHLISHDVFSLYVLTRSHMLCLWLHPLTIKKDVQAVSKECEGPDHRCCLVHCYFQDVVMCSVRVLLYLSPWKPNLNLWYTAGYTQHSFNQPCMNLSGKLLSNAYQRYWYLSSLNIWWLQTN